MSIVKSLSVGNGDMFFIRHNSDNFSIIDCCMRSDLVDWIIQELRTASEGKGISRFISTHPDDDHICGLSRLNKEIPIDNFYCVQNAATKDDRTIDFEEYCKLRDGSKSFYLSRGCARKWMNRTDELRGSAGLSILWPITENESYKQALSDAAWGLCPNNVSIILKYGVQDGAQLLWMGDLDTEFMEDIMDTVSMPRIHILFAPHHGRSSGRVPSNWLDQMKPQLIVIGEAPSEHLHYYDGYNTITQNSTGDITFLCEEGKTLIYVENWDYSVDFLFNEGMPDTFGKYIGTLFH